VDVVLADDDDGCSEDLCGSWWGWKNNSGYSDDDGDADGAKDKLTMIFIMIYWWMHRPEVCYASAWLDVGRSYDRLTWGINYRLVKCLEGTQPPQL
jgi:hypothetical protein